MDEPKFINGPWRLIAPRRMIGGDICVAGQVEDGASAILARVRPHKLPECVQLANADLIAASPDMADALRQWQHAEETGDEVELANARKSRDMALAKARGESGE